MDSSKFSDFEYHNATELVNKTDTGYTTPLAYETIQASIKDLVQTEEGASATLFLDSMMKAGGERVSLSLLARKRNLKIPRQGAKSETIIW